MNKRLCLIILFFCVLSGTAQAGQPGIVVGQLAVAEVNSCRGMVSLWPVDEFAASDHEQTDLIPPWVAKLNSDCSFRIKVSPGSYYLRAVLRNSPGEDFGPLRAGDLIFMSPETVEPPPKVDVVAGQHQHVGAYSAAWEFPGYPEQVVTGVSGRLLDEFGAPLVDHVVQAFSVPGVTDQPLAVSGPTDSKGRFKLRLREGQFYLLGRDQYGFGIPLPGRMYGFYGGESAKIVKVRKGNVVEGVEIILVPRELDEQDGK